MRALRIAIVAAAAAAAVPAAAAPLVFSGTIRADLGYGSNPFLITGVNKGAGYGAVTFNPVLTKTTAVSSTTLTGEYYREQYFNNYGHTETYSAGLGHQQQLNEHLSFNLQANYVNTDNALLTPNFNPAIVDVLTTGQRSRLFTGSLGMSWQATSRDSFTVTGNGSHSSYSGRGVLLASGYDQYGGSVGYQHTLSARTRIGVQVSATKVDSKFYPGSSSVTPVVTLTQILSPIWTFNGNIGVYLAHTEGFFSRNSTGVSFSGQLCGKYTYRDLCVSASRQTAASGVGGLRTDLEAQIQLTQRLSQRSSVSLTGVYDDSSTDNSSNLPNVLNLPKQRLFQGRLDYSRTLTQRLAAGLSGRYQWRDYAGFGNAHAIGGSVFLSYKIGRL